MINFKLDEKIIGGFLINKDFNKLTKKSLLLNLCLQIDLTIKILRPIEIRDKDLFILK